MITLERIDGSIIGEFDAETVKEAAEMACRQDISLAGVDLRGENLSFGSFAGGDFRGADLRQAQLHWGDFRGADFSYADLYRAELIRAEVYGADFTGASFDRAELIMTDFSDATLTGADLRTAMYDKEMIGAANIRRVLL